MKLACHYEDDDFGPCDLAAIGADPRHAFTCERHAFITGETLILFDREEGLRKIREQAMAYEISGSL